MLQLPKLYLITPEPAEETIFLKQVQNCLKRGIKLLRLRAATVSYLNYSTLATKIMDLCEEYDAELILDREVRTLPQAGLHLTSAQLLAATLPLPKKRLISASCHNVEELLQAERLEVDLVTLSPVLPTLSHPNAVALGWEKFAELCKTVSLPVYALGGLSAEQLPLALYHGAFGIAAIRDLWKCPGG
jgi:thiamine-phosphate diphosphorylase